MGEGGGWFGNVTLTWFVSFFQVIFFPKEEEFRLISISIFFSISKLYSLLIKFSIILLNTCGFFFLYHSAHAVRIPYSHEIFPLSADDQWFLWGGHLLTGWQAVEPACSCVVTMVFFH